MEERLRRMEEGGGVRWMEERRGRKRKLEDRDGRVGRGRREDSGDR